jgi:hypothetical protein
MLLEAQFDEVPEFVPLAKRGEVKPIADLARGKSFSDHSSEHAAIKYLADGRSGDLELEKAFLRTQFEAFRLFQDRHRKYGAGNIARMADLGLVVRLGDKMSRLEQLYKTGIGGDVLDESIIDTVLDGMNYFTFMPMVLRGRWPGATPYLKLKELGVV